MDGFILIALLTLLFVGVPLGLGYLMYYVPKKLGYPILGIILTSTFGLFILTGIILTAFEDQLFTKDDAKELLEEQQIFLSDQFHLDENKSMSSFGNYYHTFTLTISNTDKQRAVSMIKNSHDFKLGGEIIDELHLKQNPYHGPKIVMNYENEESYIREYFKPSGQVGYAPTFRRISITKIGNLLKFEDIDD